MDAARRLRHRRLTADHGGIAPAHRGDEQHERHQHHRDQHPAQPCRRVPQRRRSTRHSTTRPGTRWRGSKAARTARGTAPSPMRATSTSRSGVPATPIWMPSQIRAARISRAMGPPLPRVRWRRTIPTQHEETDHAVHTAAARHAALAAQQAVGEGPPRHGGLPGQGRGGGRRRGARCRRQRDRRRGGDRARARHARAVELRPRRHRLRAGASRRPEARRGGGFRPARAGGHQSRDATS